VNAFVYPAIVKRVVDGDTVHVDVDLGFRTWEHDVPVRIAHMNAPEKATAAGKAARDHALSLLPEGLVVQLNSHEWDKFGRVLGSIALPDGRDFAATMIADGQAVAYEGGKR
jgi:micrococcal nuclease